MQAIQLQEQLQRVDLQQLERGHLMNTLQEQLELLPYKIQVLLLMIMIHH